MNIVSRSITQYLFLCIRYGVHFCYTLQTANLLIKGQRMASFYFQVVSFWNLSMGASLTEILNKSKWAKDTQDKVCTMQVVQIKVYIIFRPYYHLQTISQTLNSRTRQV